MRFIKYLLFFILGTFFFSINVNAISWSWWPEAVLNGIEREARPWRDTRLDWVNWAWVYETLDSIKYNIVPYLRRLVYIWMSLAVIFIIYNWLLMTLTPLSGEWYAKVKKRIWYLALGIIWLTWFSLIIRIILSIVANITS